jgi:biotin transporter BioY
MDIGNYFVSLLALVPLVVLISEFLKKTFKVEKSWLKQVLSWVVAVVLCLVGDWLNLGMFKDFSLITTLAYGVATGLVANGVFDISIVQTLLNLLLNLLKKRLKCFSPKHKEVL